MTFKPGQSGNSEGRRKGVPNKKTAAKVAAIEASGLTPLDFMLSVLRNEKNDDDKRMDAAAKAAPYVHARLSSIDANIEGKVGVTVEIVRFGGTK